MGNIKMLGTHKTLIKQDGEQTAVQYHYTNVVTFDDNAITLDNGGWNTATTKRRMNQISDHYSLGFKVYQKKYDWFVDYKGKTILYQKNIKDYTRARKNILNLDR